MVSGRSTIKSYHKENNHGKYTANQIPEQTLRPSLHPYPQQSQKLFDQHHPRRPDHGAGALTHQRQGNTPSSDRQAELDHHKISGTAGEMEECSKHRRAWAGIYGFTDMVYFLYCETCGKSGKNVTSELQLFQGVREKDIG